MKKIVLILLCILILFSCLIVPVSSSAVSKNKLNKKSIVLPIGKTYVLKLKNEEKKVDWKTSDKKIISIKKTGLSTAQITAKKVGTATVTAETPTKNYKCNVTVKTLLIGHRGFSSKYPENTKEAIVGAFDNGFDGVEVDVWESKQGDIMVHHDPTLKRTTGKPGYIWDINKSTRSQYPIIKTNGIEKYDYKILIPTLQEVAKIVKSKNGYLFLHLKMKKKLGYQLSKKGANKIANIIKNNNLVSHTILVGGKEVLSLFNEQGLQLCYFKDPINKKGFEDVFKWCYNNNVKYQVFTTPENIKVYGNAKDLAQKARSYGVEFGTYTMIEKSEYQMLTNIGAYFAMSDFNLKLSTG